MATAPRPGTTPNSARERARQEAIDRRRAALRLTYNTDVYQLMLADLGPEDDRLARQAVGYPVSAAVDNETFGLDTLCLLIWTARRHAGINESYARFEREFPHMVDASVWFSDGRLKIEAVDNVDTDSQGDGDPLDSATT